MVYKKMNVLTDFITSEVTNYALYCLFEKRLGWNLYRLTGEKWREKGFLSHRFEFAYCPYQIPKKHFTEKTLTFEKFLETDINAILTTSYINEEPFYNLIKLHKPNTIFIRVITNIHETPQICRNVLLATYEPMPPEINYVNYHPELYEDFCYAPPANHKTIKSFFHHLPSYSVGFNAWKMFEEALPDFTFRMHGRDGVNGFISRSMMFQAMKDSAFVWHVKGHGGGGYTAREALASGRPCIIKKEYAVTHNDLAKNLFVDSVNCIDLDLGLERGIEMVKEWSQPEIHNQICKATAEKFKTQVNYAAEAEKIRNWINSLPRGV